MDLEIGKMSLEEIQDLKKELEKEEQKRFEEYKGKKVRGFKLCLVKSRSSRNGKKYGAWKAYKCYKGKRHVVHVGNDPREAQDKIEHYLAKNMELLSE